MALTTQDATKLGQTINPQSTLSHEAAILFDKSIVAKPLGVPQVCEIRIKDHTYRYRWVNRDGLGGRIYTERKAQGFLNATTSDVEVMSADVNTKDGEIRAGDLILMKIRADVYDAAIKSNMVKAQTLANARGFYLEGASSDVNSNSVPNRKTVSAEPGVQMGKITPFIPTNSDALVNDSIASGRVEETRAIVDDLRSSAKSDAPRK